MSYLLRSIFVASMLFVTVSATVYAGPADRVQPEEEVGSFLGKNVGEALPSLCDGWNYVWNLAVTGPGVLTGTVITDCGTWDASGTFSGANVSLTATNPVSGGSCADWFTYTGTHTGRQGRTASGTWTNSAGGSGSWTMGVCP